MHYRVKKMKVVQSIRGARAPWQSVIGRARESLRSLSRGTTTVHGAGGAAARDAADSVTWLEAHANNGTRRNFYPRSGSGAHRWSTGPLLAEWLASPRVRCVIYVTSQIVRIWCHARFFERGACNELGRHPSVAVAEQALLLALAARAIFPLSAIIQRHAEAGSTSSAAHPGARGRAGHSWFRAGCAALVRCAAVRRTIPPTPRASRTMMRPRCDTERFAEALFAHSDVCSKCEALTPATTACVSARVLAALPDGAIL